MKSPRLFGQKILELKSDNPEFERRLRLYRNHGIDNDFRQREMQGDWYYEMIDLGYNYRITDIQCALGLSQLKKLPHFLKRRREIATFYDKEFSHIKEISHLSLQKDILHAYHLYVVQIDFEQLNCDRKTIFKKMRERGIGVNVHYIPVHLHPFYREKFGTGYGLCPVAEAAYEKILSLPIFSGMSDEDMGKVVLALKESLATL